MANDEALFSSTSGIWGLGTSSLGTGVVGLVLSYPYSCIGQPLVYGRTCQNVLGTETVSEDASKLIAIILTLVAAGIFALIWKVKHSSN